jgi:hypothetical protein
MNSCRTLLETVRLDACTFLWAESSDNYILFSCKVTVLSCVNAGFLITCTNCIVEVVSNVMYWMFVILLSSFLFVSFILFVFVLYSCCNYCIILAVFL